MPIIELHADLFLEIMQDLEINTVARASNIKGGRGVDYKWYKEANYSYKLGKITDKAGNIIAHASRVVDFIETLNGYLTKLLEEDFLYGYSWENGGGYSIKIAQMTKKIGVDKNGAELKKTTYSLELEIVGVDKKIYLNKLDCKIITSKFQKAYSKCLPVGFDFEVRHIGEDYR